MELVYLWVEDYKNIKQQGFNFSPRFECEFEDKYDKDGKLEDGCELIIKTKNHLKNFFANNVNITAIVGENGSGKSSLLESLSDLLSENYSRSNPFGENRHRIYMLIYHYNHKYHILKSHCKKIKLINEKKETINWIKKSTNYKLLPIHRDLAILLLNNELKTQRLYVESERIFIENTQVDANRIKKIIISNHISHKKNLEQIQDTYFLPDTVNIKLKLYTLQENEHLYTQKINDDVNTIITSIKEDKSNPLDTFNKIVEILKLKSEPTNFISKEKGFLSTFDTQLITKRSIQNQYRYQQLTGYDELIQSFQSTSKDDNKLFHSFSIIDIDSKITKFLFALPESVFDIELLCNNKSFEDLSYGERQLLIQLHFILHNSEKSKYDKEHFSRYHETGIPDEQYEEINITNMLIFLDEFELGLHPNWQKQSINYIVNFLKKIDKNFNLIITSHSPFILSDLPKENVIFLDKYTQKEIDENGIKQKVGNCKNVTNDITINPFGANIHTLLSHGFFMRNGLMGEFAKNKINKILRFLNDDNKFIDFPINQIKAVIENIGEDFLRSKLLSLYDKKYFEEFKDRKKEALLRQIEKLQEQYDEIEDD